MGELTDMILKTDLQGKIEAGDMQIIQIRNLEFLAMKQELGFLMGCKQASELIDAWDAERQLNFTEDGKPRDNYYNTLSWKKYKALRTKEGCKLYD